MRATVAGAVGCAILTADGGRTKPLTVPRSPRVRVALLAGLLVVASVAIGFARRRDPGASFELRHQVPSRAAFSAALQQTVGLPLRAGHAVALLEDGDVFDAVVEEIGRARSSIHIEIYIWSDGSVSNRVLAALERRGRGVRCGILLDAFGSAGLGAAVKGRMQQAGCEVLLFRPSATRIARNHRKLVVVDGRVGFTGGFAIDDRWAGRGGAGGKWRDTAVRVEGPAVDSMQEAFAEDWQEAGGDFLPPSDFPELGPAHSGSRAAFVRSAASPVVTRAEKLTQLAIKAARHRLWIANAYFVPGDAVLHLLGERAAQGVDVRILVPGREDDSKLSFLWQQREYRQLRERGVRVWEYQPAMMHAKTIVVDDDLAVVGSVNLDPLSLDRLEEGAAVLEDRALVSRLARDFEADLARSREQR